MNLPEDRANLLAKHLSGVFRWNPVPGFDDGLSPDIAATCDGLRELGGDPLPRMDRPEVLAVIGGRNNGKATGTDGIGNRALKDRLIDIINAMLQLGYFPVLWRRADVVMAPKPRKDRCLLITS